MQDHSFQHYLLGLFAIAIVPIAIPLTIGAGTHLSLFPVFSRDRPSAGTNGHGCSDQNFRSDHPCPGCTIHPDHDQWSISRNELK